MKKHFLLIAPLLCLLSGCLAGNQSAYAKRMVLQSQAMGKYPNAPDVAIWQAQRENISVALGERVLDKDFNRVFNALIIALPSMGMAVENIERQSGYIATRGLPALNLSPDQLEQFRREEIKDWCQANGYPIDLFEPGWDPPALWPPLFGYQSFPPSKATLDGKLTLTVLKQGENQCKMKMRLTGIYYPKLLEEYYKLVWPKLDKQIFLDKALD